MRNRVTVPAHATALGVPAVMKLDACDESVTVASAALYVANARHYREGLREL